MNILIDADGCPVVDLTLQIVKQFDVPATPAPAFFWQTAFPGSRFRNGWAMAMRQHDAIRPKDRVDGRCSRKKEWTDE